MIPALFNKHNIIAKGAVRRKEECKGNNNWERMAFEAPEQGENFFKLELDEDGSSIHTESEDLNSPQVEATENELSMVTFGIFRPIMKLLVLT